MKKQKVNQKTTHNSCRRGMSLIELLVVLGIISVLLAAFAVAGVGYLNYRKRLQTDLTLNAAVSAVTLMNEGYGRPLDHAECQYYTVVDGAGNARTMTPTEFFLYKCSFSAEAYAKLSSGQNAALVNSTMTAGRPAANRLPETVTQVKVLYTHPDKANPTNPWLVDVATDYAAGDPSKPGYALVTLVDGWGGEIEYRLSRQDLAWDTNADSVLDKPNDPFLPASWTVSPFWTGWVGAGFDVKYGTAVDPNLGVANPVNPAMPNYDFAYFASAGADGRWGVLAGHQLEGPDADAKDNLYSVQPKSN